MLKNIKNITFKKLFLLTIILVSAGILFLFHSSNVYAASNITFSSDTILDLDGLGTTVYIEAGSEMGGVSVSGKQATFTAINNLVLKTDTHKIIEIPSTSGTFDLTISSDHISSDGYLAQWDVPTNSDTEDFIIHTQQSYTYYSVALDGTPLENSPFDSGSSASITLSLSQTGTYTIGVGCGPRAVRGWGWSDNIGWISFSCLNEYNEGEGIDYGLDIDESTGVFSGYAWNDNVGWISFNSSDLTGCPSGTCEATLDLVTGDITGWAKVLNTGEWISLSGTADDGSEYGLEVIGSNFHGWAWGDSAVGWTSFSCENQSECSTSDYQVWTTIIIEELLVRTDPATNVSVDSNGNGLVTLNGMLFGMGGESAVDVWFEWGTSQSTLGNSTTKQTLSGTGAFSADLTGLTVGETYYYKALAQNSQDTKEGNVLSFKVMESEGDIILKYNEKQKSIQINSEGKIEISD